MPRAAWGLRSRRSRGPLRRGSPGRRAPPSPPRPPRGAGGGWGAGPVGRAGAACLAVFSALAVGGDAPASAPRPGGARKEVRSRAKPRPRMPALAASVAAVAWVAIAGAREMSALAAAGRARVALEQVA